MRINFFESVLFSVLKKNPTLEKENNEEEFRKSLTEHLKKVEKEMKRNDVAECRIIIKNIRPIWFVRFFYRLSSGEYRNISFWKLIPEVRSSDMH